RYRERLLVDLLEHVVTVRTFLSGVRRELTFTNRTLDRVALPIHDADRLAPDLGHITFLEEHESAGGRKKRGDIGCHKSLFHAQPDDDRATFAGQDEPLRILFTHHCQGVGTLQLRDGGANCLEEVAHCLQMSVNPVSDDLRIRLRGEPVSRTLELLAQLVVVFDDPVVNDSYTTMRYMRVSITLAGNAVRGPAGMSNSYLSGGRCVLQCFVEHANLADGSQPIQMSATIEYRDSRGVIAAILQPVQPFHQDRHHIPLGDCSDDSAHRLQSISAQRPRSRPKRDSSVPE